MEDATVRLGARTLLDGVNWLVGPGDRIGIVGGNGAGKSTLLRVLAGTQALDAGTGARRRDGPRGVPVPGTGRAARPARVLEAVEEVARRVNLGGRELSAAQLAEVFGFTERRLWTPVADLSGGERRRLQLLRLLAGEPNVLLLDEPTNDLDTDTLASLEDLLDTWPGTMVIASHDRYLVERVCDTVYALYGDGRLTHLPGGIDEYLAVATHGRSRPEARSDASTSRAAGLIDRRSRRGGDCGPRRRNWRGWSGRSASWSSARRSCTSSWPSTPPTTRR